MKVRLRDDRLRERLARSRRSQNAWAVRVGLSRGHWSDLVNGKHPYPSAKTRRAMLEALSVEFDTLFEVESVPDAAVGREIEERYELEREIGEGGMGRILAARDLRFGRKVAIKMVSEEALADLGPERFLQEVRRAARLVHPHVLPLFDAGEVGGRAFLVAPLIEAGSLRDRLARNGALAPPEALRIARGVASALDQAHAVGVLHGDVKPENVLLADGHPYLTDFGLSRALRQEVRREWERPPEIDIAAGTPAYVSPEQARGERLDGRSDVYSLACMIFEMLAGRPPFEGTTTTEIVKRRFDAVPPDLTVIAPAVPVALARVLAGAMSLDRDRRPASAGALVERLAAALLLHAPSTGAERRGTAALAALGSWAITRTPHPRGRIMPLFLEDLRRSSRALIRRPVFSIIAIATLALGIGANAALFSVIEAVVLRPLPFDEPDRLVRIYSTYEGRLCCTVSVPSFLDVRAEAELMRLAAYGGAAFTIHAGGAPERVSGYRVSGGFFELLGAEPVLGRFPTVDDERAAAESVVVLAHSLWRDRYQASREVLGRTLSIDGVPHAIVGVAPPDLRLSGQPELFVPFAWDPDNLPSRGSNFLIVLGRPVDGSPVEAAMAEISALYERLVEQYPDSITNRGVGHRSVSEWLVGAQRERQLFVLWGAVAMVLLVACVNVMNLMLARAESRQRELAVRAALGAGRTRLVVHFLSESVLISMIGGAIGLVAGYAGLRALLAGFGGAVPRAHEIGLSPEVLGFTTVVAIGTGLMVGVVPALQVLSEGSMEGLREGGRGSTGGGGHLRQTLVILEVALALVLVVGAGLMLKSFWQLTRVDLGVDPGRVLSARVTLPSERYPDPAAVASFFERLREEMRRQPGVEAVGLGTATPFSGTWNNYSVVFPVGRPELEASFVEARTADAGFFETLQIEIVRGSPFDGSEDPEGPTQVIVNEELIRQLLPAEDPIGVELVTGPNSTPWTIRGVVENVREHGPDRAVPPTVYFAAAQGYPGSMSVLTRTAGDPLALAPVLRGVVGDLDPDLPIYQVARLDELVSQGLGGRRFAMALLGSFAGIALTLGAIGIYGVMAYSVEQRRREIGLRQALGASRGSVLQLVVRQGSALALVGVVLGTVAAYLLRGYVAGFLYEVSSFDLPTYAAVAVALTAVAVLACLLPARRAAAVDPMAALREE